jgi:serine protease Do
MPGKLKLITFVFVVAGFMAIPAESVRAEPGFVGLQVQGMDAKVAKALGLRSPSGVLIKDVAVGEPGAIAGLRRGDVITRFDGKTIREFKDLLAAVSKTNPGEEVDVEVQRQGKTVKVEMELAPRPIQWKIKRDAFHNFPILGFTVAALTEKVRERFSIRWGSIGLAVTIISENGIVGKIDGLRPGDVIIQANLKDLWHPRHLTRQIQEVKKAGRESILLLVEGEGGYRYTLMPLDKS